MRRALTIAGGVLVGGLAALGCSSTSTASAPTSAPTSTTTTAAPTTPLAWLIAEAKPANKLLNSDQAAVVDASRSSTEVGATTYFSHLATACTAMLHDARRAAQLPEAPSPTLASAWHAMTTATATYASDCLALTRSHSNAAFTTWNSSIQPMDSANAALNSVVAAIRGQATPSG